MSDKGPILAGLFVFLTLITFPVWYNLAAGTTSAGPDVKLPTDEKTCVAPRDYIKNNHMALLVEWRDQVVRDADRTFLAFDGRSHEKSLTRTCLKCHDSKQDFCDKCHDYAAVAPACWDCHIDPQLVRQGAEYARR